MSQKWLLISLGLVFGFAIIYWARQGLHRQSYWISITGQVVDNILYGSSYKPVVEFKDRTGQIRQFTEQMISRPHRPWPLYSSISVRYNPQDSSQAVVDKPTAYFVLGILGIVFSAVCICAGLFML